MAGGAPLELDGQVIALCEVAAVARGERPVELSPRARARMGASRAVVEGLLGDQPVYGVNTGFGKLADVPIPPSDLAKLQVNLVRSHACGLGDPLSEAEIRAMLLLRANVLAKGLSGARPVVAETLVSMLNQGVLPVIPEKGSVGASGDLAPLAHLALVVIGEGEALFAGRRVPGGEAMRAAGLTPLTLEAKEGLALLNGTQAMTAAGALALRRAIIVASAANVAGAMSLEALMGTPVAFDARIHAARPHTGQAHAAERLVALLEGSEIRESHRKGDPRVQDAYSLRCMPQVHGAARDALEFAARTIETETGSGTDNPLVFAESGDVLSGGNFHGAPVALALDFAAIALTDLASICERRIDRLVNPDLNEGLPPFLTRHPGVSSGFMIAHVAAVSLLAEMKVLAHPASVDNLPTSGGKEDHVSMGMTCALKLRQSVANAERVVAIELLAAAEGLEHRKPLRPGRGVQKACDLIRAKVAPLGEDRPLSGDIESVAEMVRSEAFESV